MAFDRRTAGGQIIERWVVPGTYIRPIVQAVSVHGQSVASCTHIHSCTHTWAPPTVLNDGLLAISTNTNKGNAPIVLRLTAALIDEMVHNS